MFWKEGFGRNAEPFLFSYRKLERRAYGKGREAEER